MKRQSINPWDWGLQFGMDQGEVVEGATRHLSCSGQTAIKTDPDAEMGISVVAPNDVRAQMQFSLECIDAVLEKAGMSRKDLTSLRFFTTDVDAFLQNYDVYAEWIGGTGIRPPQSLIGVQRLVLPELTVEIEATAAA